MTGIGKEVVEVGRLSQDESEMLMLIESNNPFVHRGIALNENITEKVADKLLEYAAYTMCTNLAKNKVISEYVKDKLYKLADTKYTESTLKEDLDGIYKGTPTRQLELVEITENTLTMKVVKK